MIHETPPPNLGQIAARAITEVLATQLKLRARQSELIEWRNADQRRTILVGSVKLTGAGCPAMCTSVCLKGSSPRWRTCCWGEASPNRRSRRHDRRTL